ncbi:MAG: molybdopterin converting factor subunit 1 [Gemmataceae bacterium]
MTLTVHLFAAARDLAGAAALPIDLPDGSTVSDLRAALAARVPALAALLARSAVAVDHDFAENGHVLTAAAEVAVIPPVSGG